MDNRDIELILRCPLCRKAHSVMVTDDEYWEWRDGDRDVKDIFSDRPATVREQLISNICPSCQNKIKN